MNELKKDKTSVLLSPTMSFSPLDALINCLSEVRKASRVHPGDTVGTVNGRIADVFRPIVLKIAQAERERLTQQAPAEDFVLPELSRASLEAVISSPRYDAVHKQLAKALLQRLKLVDALKSVLDSLGALTKPWELEGYMILEEDRKKVWDSLKEAGTI